MQATDNPRYLLVDGHSVIFHWEELCQLHARDRKKAREQLIRILQGLHDASDWLVTLVFDGTASDQASQEKEKRSMVIIYASKHQTADSIIEKIVGAHPTPDQISVVTADHMERYTIENLGAYVFEPLWLRSECECSHQDLERELERTNRRAKW